MKKVFISIINFNGQENTMECLESLDKLMAEDINLRVVVIDNASKIKFQLDKRKLKNLSIEVIYNDKNAGFSGGQNIGIKHAIKNGADFVILLNNDVTVGKYLINELLKASGDEEIGIVSPKIYFSKGTEFHKDRYKKEELGRVFWYAGGHIDWDNVIGINMGVDEVDSGQFDTIKDTEFATGCCMLIRKEVIKKIGYLDENYFLYYEDTDYSVRAKRAGFEIVFAPRAVLWHKNAGSTGGSGSGMQDYFITRNRMYFGMKYAPFRSKSALIREGLRLLVSGRDSQKKGIRDYYLRKFGKGTYFGNL